MSRRFILPRPIRKVPEFFIKENGAYHLLRTDDILYFENAQDDCRCVSIHGQSFRLSSSFNELVTLGNFSDSFLPVHKWLVHLHHLKRIVQNQNEIRIKFTNGITLIHFERNQKSERKNSSNNITV